MEKCRCNGKFILQWHLTERCNLKCKHCYQDCNKNGELDISQLSKIINEFNKFIQENNYKGHINFTGGEPLLVLDTLKVLTNQCDELGITYGILTNGTLITSEITEELSKMKKLAFIQMSLEGGKKTNDYIRGKGTFDKVRKAIRLLKNKHIKTMISFTCSESNYKELRKLIWICRILGVNKFWTDRYIPIHNEDNIKNITTEHYKRVVKILGQESKLNIGGLNVEHKRALQGLEDGCGYKCSAGDKLIVLLPNGDILPCRRLPINIDNIIKINFDFVKALEKCKNKIKELEDNKCYNDCNGCKHKSICNGGSKCLTYAIRGKLGGKDINCWYKEET